MKELEFCVFSLIHQILKSVEDILVDNASPDNYPAMCEEYAKQDNRIKVIHKVNEDLSDAWNAGLM